MNKFNRWLEAKNAEKTFWAQKDVKALKTTDDWQDFLIKTFGLDFSFFNGKKVLEVGCGPFGIIHFVDSSLAVGLDPIVFESWSNFDFRANNILSLGETLPFKDQTFDVCICFNVIDHAIFPRKIMDELIRVLKPNGTLLLWVHCARKPLNHVLKLFPWIDKQHPYHFTSDEIMQLGNNISSLSLLMSKSSNLGDSNVLFSFVKFFPISFKLAVGSIFMFNVFLVLKRNSDLSTHDN